VGTNGDGTCGARFNHFRRSCFSFCGCNGFGDGLSVCPEPGVSFKAYKEGRSAYLVPGMTVVRKYEEQSAFTA
jgi:hypothetical protein